jgi:hypothetical protein
MRHKKRSDKLANNRKTRSFNNATSGHDVRLAAPGEDLRNLRAVVQAVMGMREIHVEVAGGIVRHDIR